MYTHIPCSYNATIHIAYWNAATQHIAERTYLRRTLFFTKHLCGHNFGSSISFPCYLSTSHTIFCVLLGWFKILLFVSIGTWLDTLVWMMVEVCKQASAYIPDHSCYPHTRVYIPQPSCIPATPSYTNTALPWMGLNWIPAGILILARLLRLKASRIPSFIRGQRRREGSVVTGGGSVSTSWVLAFTANSSKQNWTISQLLGNHGSGVIRLRWKGQAGWGSPHSFRSFQTHVQ